MYIHNEWIHRMSTNCERIGLCLEVNNYEISRRQMNLRFFFFVALWPNAGYGLLVHEVSRSHTSTHQIRYDSSGRAISSSQRPLPDNTHNTHKRQTPTSPEGFKPTISAGERPQTIVLESADTGTGELVIITD